MVLDIMVDGTTLLRQPKMVGRSEETKIADETRLYPRVLTCRDAHDTSLIIFSFT